MEIGLNIVSVLENGVIFDAKQLHIDEKEYADNFTLATQWAMNLAVEMAYVTEETTDLLLGKAFREAKAVGLEGNWLAEELKEELLARAEAQALSIKEEGQIEAQIEPKPLEASAHQEIVAEESPQVEPHEPIHHSEPKVEHKVEHHLPAQHHEQAMPSSPAPQKTHPKQGHVTNEEAEELLKKLQKT
jgi:hypothetical protein